MRRFLIKTTIPIFITLAVIAAMADDTPTPPTPPAPPAPPALTTIVQNVEGENLLADTYNRTLYVFDIDQNQTTPKCDGACAELWPPYILTAAEQATLKTPLGTIMRTSHKMQLTYNGRPVYTYGFDRIKGDDQGNGIGNVWHYIEVAPPTPPTPTP